MFKKFVGTAMTGNTFPGATLPHGMVQLSPVAIPPKSDLWAYNSGYHQHSLSQSSTPFTGIAHTALAWWFARRAVIGY